MKKHIKLILLGILTFIVFFVVILMSTGIFSAFQPTYKEGEYYKAPDGTSIEKRITIENGSFDTNEVSIPKGKLVGFRIYNNDKVSYRVLFMKKQNNEVKALHESFIKPGEEKLEYGFYYDLSMYSDMPEKVKQEEDHVVMTDRFELIYTAARCLPSEECILTCTNCRGSQVQIKAKVE
ncbi:MAG: hypothetical protein QXM75_00395 [Candidatus Diapherotrites archaeon]